MLSCLCLVDWSHCSKKMFGKLTWKSLVARMVTILIKMVIVLLCCWMFLKDSWSLRYGIRSFSCSRFSKLQISWNLSWNLKPYIMMVSLSFGFHLLIGLVSSTHVICAMCLLITVWICVVFNKSVFGLSLRYYAEQ